MLTDSTRAGARALTVTWAGFWTYFIVGSVLHGGGGIASNALVVTIGVIFFCSNCAIVWLFEHAAGIVLVSEAVILTVLNYTFLLNTAATQMFLLMTLCLPPLATGLMLLNLTVRSHRSTR